MSAEIVKFPQKTTLIEPLAQFIRLGENSYKRTASLFAEGHLAAKRVVVDASRLRFLKAEIGQLKEKGVELVLDTKAAELAALRKFGGNAKDAPWSQIAGGGLLGKDVFLRGHPSDLYGQIARCAVENRMNAVLSPSHFIQGGDPSGWLDIDRSGCVELRRALDREGGQKIAIDYLLILPHLSLNDSDTRSILMQALFDLPFDNLWIRASGFGNDSSAQPLVAFISALVQLHNLGKPIITDYLGGLVGEAVMALGASSGFAHGIIESERFDARSWDKPPEKRDPEKSGGRATRISLSILNRTLTVKEYETLLSAKGARRLLLPDPALSHIHTSADVIHDPRALASREAVAHFEAMASIPNIHRSTDFIRRRVEPAISRMQQIKNLAPSAEIAKAKDINLEKLMKRMSEQHKQLGRQSNSLTELIERLKDRGMTARSVQRLSPVEIIGRRESQS